MLPEVCEASHPCLLKKCIAERPRSKTPNYMNPQALALSVYSLTSVQSCFSPAPFLSRLLIAGEHLPLQTLSKQLLWKNSTCRQIPALHQTFSQVWGISKEYTDKKPCPHGGPASGGFLGTQRG